MRKLAIIALIAIIAKASIKSRFSNFGKIHSLCRIDAGMRVSSVSFGSNIEALEFFSKSENTK